MDADAVKEVNGNKIDLSADESVSVQKINDTLTPAEISARQDRLKNVMKVVLWTDPVAAPIMAAKLVAQKIVDKKIQQSNMTPQVQKILDDLQVKVGVSAGIPAEALQSDDPPTEIKNTVVDGHSINDAAKYLSRHKVFLKMEHKNPFKEGNAKESSFDNDTGSAPDLDLGIMKYFDEARHEAMKLAIQSRTKALATINSIELSYKQHIEDASELKKEAAPNDVKEAQALLSASDKKSIAASVNTLTVDTVGQSPKAPKIAAGASAESEEGNEKLWLIGAVASFVLFTATTIWYIRTNK